MDSSSPHHTNVSGALTVSLADGLFAPAEDLVADLELSWPISASFLVTIYSDDSFDSGAMPLPFAAQVALTSGPASEQASEQRDRLLWSIRPYADRLESLVDMAYGNESASVRIRIPEPSRIDEPSPVGQQGSKPRGSPCCSPAAPPLGFLTRRFESCCGRRTT